MSHTSAPNRAGDVARSFSPASPATRGITRRTIFASLSAAVLPAALAACGQTSQTSGGGETAKPAAATGKLTWAYSDNPQSTGFDQIEAAFKEKYPEIQFDVLHTPKDFYDSILAMFSAGNQPDVFRLNDDFVKAWNHKNLLAPLEKYMKSSGIKKEDYFDAVINFPVQNGKTVSWFLGANPRLIYYNVDTFKQQGVKLPPRTWQKTGWTFDEFVDAARRLTRLNEQPGVYGACVYDDTGNEQTFSINNGSPTGIYSKDGRKFTLADPPGYESIQWIADLTHKHRVQPTRQIASELKGADDMFINEQLGMWYNN
ncbi:MAG: ABC transporter substrate-binding protein, partial [Chloroflexota bacterium]